MDTKDATSQLMSLQNRINKTAQKIEALTRKQQELGATNVPTKEYAEIQAHLQRAEGQMDKLIAKQAKMQAMGNTKGSAWKSLQLDMMELGRAIEADKIDMQQLVSEGRAFTVGTATADYQRVNMELQNANGEMAQLNQKARELVQKENQASNGAKKFGKTMKGASQKANKGFSNLLRTMKQMVLSMAVFNIMFKGLEFLKSGLQNLAVYSKEYNKSMSELSSSTGQLKNAFAVAFQPILNVVIPILSRLISALSSACNAVSRFFAILGGKATYTKAIKQNKDYAASLDKVGGASEDAKSSLAGFDDLNVLQKDTGESGGGGGSTEGADASGFQEVAVDAPDWISGIKDAIEAGDWYSVGSLVAEKLNSAISSINFDGVSEVLTGRINALLHTVNGFVQTFDFRAAGAKIGEFVNEITTTIQNVDWASAGQAFSAGWSGIFDGLSGFLQEVDWMELGSSVYEAIIEFITNIDWAGLTSSLFEFIGSALGGIGAFIGGVLIEAWEDIKEAWSQVVLWWQEVAYEDGEFTMEGLLQGILDKFADIGTWIVDHIFTPFIDGFKNAFGIHSPSTVMQEMGTYIIDGLKNGMTGMWDKVKGIITGFKTNIQTAFSNIRTTAVSIFTSLKTRVSSIFSGMWNAVKGVINSMLSGVESMANGVINGINGMIGALNNLSFSIPDWVPGLGGKSFGLSIGTIGNISIPRLANGGITTGSTLANIGEAGREAILPLENNTGWMDDLASKLASKMPTYGTPGTLIMEVDGREFARLELPYFDEESNRVGVSLALG